MAKRKRLTPANPDFLGTDLSPTDAEALRPEPMPEDLETKGYPLGVVRTRTRSATSRPPIAQVAGEASAAAALSELTEAMTTARVEGRLIQSLTLSQIDTAHLVRDRLFADEEELGALIESLRKRGQQTPIEVVDRGEGAKPRYGLISGWRRMAALARLATEEPRFNSVLALVRSPKTSADAYVAMVEENEIRVGLSFYERARIVVKAVEQGVYPDLKTALNDLFANVSRTKRSKIKSFTVVVEALDGILHHPTVIGERLGLDLAKRLENPDECAMLRATLSARPAMSAEEEQTFLSALISVPTTPPAMQGTAVASSGGANARGAPAAIEVTFDAGSGRIILEGPGVDSTLAVALERWLRRQ